jgi:hypothetical protein
MSGTIKTYKDLCEERDRVKSLLIVQKQRVKDDWDEFKHEFTPVQNAFGVIGKMAKPDASHPIMNAGLKAAADMFISNFILGRAGWLVKLTVPFVVKNYSSHLIAEKGKPFFEKIGQLLKGKKRQQQPVLTASTTV